MAERDPDPPRGEPEEPHGPEEPRDDSGAGGDNVDFERRWQQIVAGIGPIGPPPANLTPEGPSGPGTGTADGNQGEDEQAVPEGLAGPRDYAVEDDSVGFVAPDPPALGSGRPAVVLSILGAAGAPLALMITAVLWPAMPNAVLIVLFAAFMAGAVGLFFVLPRDRDRDGPGNDDDGARV